MPPDGGRVFGTVNQIRWTADGQTIVITLTDGFDILGDELIIPNGLVGTSGLPSIGSQPLNLNDTVPPEFTGIDHTDDDGSGVLSLGDHYVFHFNEAMNTSVIEDGTGNANMQLRPQGGERYGAINGLSWSVDQRDLTVEITEGFTEIGDEVVIPTSFLTDVAGNSVTGIQQLTGKDSTPPQFVQVRFDDADGGGSVTTEDRYFIEFSESMRTSALSNQTIEANNNLSPAGKKYGDVNDIEWNAEGSEVVIRITPGFTINGTETLTAAGLLTDRAGNTVSNTIDLNLADVIAPELAQLFSNFISPVNTTAEYQITVQYNSSMNPAVNPLIALTSSGVTDPIVSGTGTWLTTFFTNDTFMTDSVSLVQGMDGVITADVSNAQDWMGINSIPANGLFAIELDATAPENPTIIISNVTCESATLDWTGYAASPDLSGFQLYQETSGAFTEVDGQSFIHTVSAGTRSHTLTNFMYNVQYHVAVVAMDNVGNFNPSVDSHGIFIEQAISAPVTITVGAGTEPGSALINWTSYDTSSLCGFSGFRVYVEESDYTDVSPLTPLQTLDPNFTETVINGLERTKTFYLAVVGFNETNEAENLVSTEIWSDPFAGTISSDLIIGDGDQKEIEIIQTLVITNDALVTLAPGTTLYFAPGTGITVEQGRLLAQGTSLDPVRLTSQNDQPGGTPTKGDWLGVILNAGDTGSELKHLFLEFGQGLHLNGSAPIIEALTVRQNTGAGLRLSQNANLNTSDALVRYNDVGVQIETGAQLTIANSVIKNNNTNASSDGTQVLNAENNWWGFVDAADIATTISTNVNTAGHLTSEPILTPAIGTGNRNLQVTTANVTLWLPSRNAEEMRISEDINFTNVFFDQWQVLLDF